MKRRIFALLLCCTFVVATAAFLVTAAIFYERLREELCGDLRSEAAVMRLAAERGAPAAELARAASPGTRLSLIGADGSVLFDTAESEASHADRPEVQEALKTGSGEASRKSETLLRESYYYALRLDDGVVLRLSRDSGALAVLLEGGASALLPVFFLVMALLCVALSALFARAMTKPFSESVRELNLTVEDADGGRAMRYPEFEPFRRSILYQRRQTRQFIAELHGEKRRITDIIESMREGLILLDGERQIVLINDSARRILHAQEEHSDGRNVVEVLRAPELLDAIRKSADGGGAKSCDREIGGRSYRFFVSPSAEGGAILFIVDVTELKKAEEIRRDFAANVSHELKTPLTSISGFSEMISSGMVAKPEEVRRMAGIIHTEASRLIGLVCDIIRLSEIENLKGAGHDPVELSSVAEDAVRAVRGAAEKREVNLSCELEPVTTEGDRTMLFEIFYNLLDNAVKYNRPGGTVRLELKKDCGQALIRVSDTGIGIDSEHLDRIFERFYRVDKSRSKETGGTGLGLSIVKHAAEFHGGRVAIQSEPGSGTTITVRLPCEGR